MSNDIKNNEQEQNINSSKDFLVGAFIGGIVGALTALFLAPKSGRELRTDINEQVGMLKEKTDQWKDAAVEKGNELAAAAKEKTEQLRETAIQKSNELTDVVRDSSGSNSDHLEDVEEATIEKTDPTQNE